MAVVVEAAVIDMVEAMHVRFVIAAELVDMAATEYNEAVGDSINSVHNSSSNRNVTVSAAAMDVGKLIKKALPTRVFVFGAPAPGLQPKTAREEEVVGINNNNSNKGSVKGRGLSRLTQ